ncbi:MAG: TspO/MBR family protein [Ardenticatenaceae bacterium]
MTPSFNKRAFAQSIGLCFMFALFGTLLVGDALETWFDLLVKPAILVPLWVFILVGVLYYVLFIGVLYRIFTRIESERAKRQALGWALLVLLLNELFNYVFFGWQSTLAGFVGIVIFLPPLSLLIASLWKSDRPSAIALLPYWLWVIYDLVWTYQLWQLNG